MKNFLKFLIYVTIGTSLIAAFVPFLQQWLFFSVEGIKHFFFWQLLSYPLVQKGPVSFSFFLTIAFNMYLLWVFGSSFIERAGYRLFILLYFGASFLGALASFAVPHAVLAGSQNSVYAIMLAWMLLNQHSKLLLFFSIPIPSKWLILGLITATILVDLGNGLWADAVSLLIACLYSYLFILTTFKHPSPFPFLSRFEKKLFQILEKKRNREKNPSSKIYDIKSGKPVLDDEQFMDAMLDRISRHGEASLTEEEKKRMHEISSKKRESH